MDRNNAYCTMSGKCLVPDFCHMQVNLGLYCPHTPDFFFVARSNHIHSLTTFFVFRNKWFTEVNQSDKLLLTRSLNVNFNVNLILNMFVTLN